MPRENNKRGRRGEQQKRKFDDAAAARDGVEIESPKRQKLADGDAEPFADQHDHQPFENGDNVNGHSHQAADRPFFGMLDEEEQEYFRKADEMLELNSFADPEERNLFLSNVYREADGKELKLANSQSCSRLMERLIQLSSPQQLKTLFQKFNGNFVHLIQHRFASHCCEKLFTEAARTVTEEFLSPPDPEAASISIGGVYVPMEGLFLHTVAELEGSIGFLMTDPFASHALRVLLLVLAGEPISSSVAKSLLQSKKKENIQVNGAETSQDASGDRKREVPKSFTGALEKLMADSVAGLDTNGIRSLATHRLGNPTLQLLVRLELTHFGKQRAKNEMSILRTLIPDDPITPDSDSASFVNGLMYDPIGSHLMETIVEFAPGKMFKNLYKEFFRERIGMLARNEIAGYVACKVLERLSREDLVEAHEHIVAQMPNLLERNRVAPIKTLIQRCAVRGVDTQAIAVKIDEAFRTEGEFDMTKLLKLSEEPTQNGDGARPATHAHDQSTTTSGRVQGSTLAQAMILVPGPLSGLIFDSLAKQSTPILLKMATDPVASRTLQAAMTSTNAGIVPRRKLVQQFYGQIGNLALDRSGSRVVDSIWEGTHGLAFIRERIAEELAENEAALRDSPCGRAVWKNWKMDLYKRRRNEWVLQSKNKASNDGFQSFSELDKNLKKVEITQDGQGQPARNNTANANGKTPLQLARERHAARKQNSERRRTHQQGQTAGPAR